MKKDSTQKKSKTKTSAIYSASDDERNIHFVTDINTILQLYDYLDSLVFITKKKQGTEYINLPVAFDIETTSFQDDTLNLAAIMYEWTMSINGFILIGRTWQEFTDIYNILVRHFETSAQRHLVIYIHNFAFEFQFMRKHLKWAKVFSIEERKPVYAVTEDGIEFRCSYILTGKSLAKIGEDLKKYKVKKMVGDLDYALKRHSGTEITDEELQYCINDVQIIVCFLAEKFEAGEDISKIPLTNTGYVRKYCRNYCFYGDKHNKYQFNKYRSWMNVLKLDVPQYHQLQRGFQGGFTHCSCWYSGKTLEKVSSIDFTSSYPTVMVAEKYPMSAAEIIKIEDWDTFKFNLTRYCCLFDIEFCDIEASTLIDMPISESKCWNLTEAVIDNGRIFSAKTLRTTLTEQDYFIIARFYKWKSVRIGTFRRYQKGYLPTPFVKSILQLYQDKTQLKNVKGKETDYMLSKNMLNSCYGMCATNPCHNVILYDNDDEWQLDPCNIEDAINKYNESKNRFLFYAWGIWVTAYARRNLFGGIYEFGNDYVYSDTDSIKCLNIERHQAYIDNYNKRIIEKLTAACQHHRLPVELIKPKTIEGKEKPLGVWDFEGTYDKFKSLGAKRYIVEKDGEIEITVSGLNKHISADYIANLQPDPFTAFNDGLYIPGEFTGKNIHTYIDDEITGILTDYKGNDGEYTELSGIHLSESDYSLSIGFKYAQFLKGVSKLEYEAT